MPSKKAAPAVYLRPHLWWHDKTSAFFGGTASIVVKHPKIVIVLCFLFTAICGIGMGMLEPSVGDPWVPAGAWGVEIVDDFEAIYGTPPRISNVLVESADGGSILTKAKLIAATQLCIDIENAVGADGTTFDEICVGLGPNVPGCLSTRLNLPTVWGYNITYMEMSTEAQLLQDLNDAEARMDGYDGTLGSYEREDGQIVSATAIKLSWFLQGVNLDSTDEDETKAGRWEAAMLETAEEANSDEITVYRNAARSTGDELSALIGGDVLLVNVAIALIVVYTSLVVGRLNCLQSRVALGLGGILSVGCSIIAGYGLGGLIGIPFDGVSQVIPFLALGIGVDDMFIILDAFRATERPGPPRRPPHGRIFARVVDGLREAGPSISMTTLTDAYVFLISTTTRLPALRWFSLYACFVIVIDFVFQCTMFVAFVYLDAQRIAAGRRDCCCCCSYKFNTVEDTDGDAEMKDAAGRVSPGDVEVGEDGFDNNEYQDNATHEDLLKRPVKEIGVSQAIFSRVYGPALTKPVVKVVVLLITVGLLAMAGYGLSTLEENFSFKTLIGEDSYVVQYSDAVSDNFASAEDLEVQIVLRDTVFSPYDPDKLGRARTIYTAVQEDPASYDTDMTLSFLENYVDFLATTYPAVATSNGVPTAEADFYTYLNEFLATPDSSGGGATFANDVVFASDARDGITAARFYVYIYNGDTPQKNVAAMDQVRELTDSSGIDCFPFAFVFPLYETYRIILSEALQNVGLSLLGVLVIMLVYVHPGAAFMVFFAIAFTFVDLLGTAALWDVDLNSISVANLLIAIGLGVDYSAHVAHKFTVSTGTNDERLLVTLDTMGKSVFNGAATTMLGILVLAFAQSGIFVVFFKMLFLTVFYGAFHGLVALPVVLSLVMPAAPHASSSDGDGDGDGKAGGSHGTDDSSGPPAVQADGDSAAPASSRQSSGEPSSSGESESVRVSSNE